MFEGFPSHWSTLKKLIWLYKGVMKAAGWVWKTVTGSLLHITDALAGDVSALSVAIEPVQSGSGDPAPDNVRPISGWTQAKVTRTGKNLFDPTSTSTEWVGGNGSIYEVPGAKTMRIPVLPGQPLTISNANASSGTNMLLIAYFDASGTMLARNVAYSGDKYKTATAPANTAYAIVGFYTWSESSQQQLEFGSTATAYEPYAGTTLPISWQSEAGTIYGGTLDVVSGVLTVTMSEVELSTLGWSGSTSTRYISERITAMKEFDASEVPNMAAEQYKTIKWSDGLANNPNGIAVNSNKSLYLYKDANTSTPSGKIVYELATPVTYQLTPAQLSTLAGENNVWADTGNITMTYMAQEA